MLTELVPVAIEKVEKALNESAGSFRQAAKLSYCKALYSYYLGFTEDAIRLFIGAKNDREFGLDALFKAANLLINPENEIMGGEMFHSQFEDDNENTQDVSNRMAEKFLNVCATRYSTMNGKRFSILILISNRDYVSCKQEIQKNYADSLDLQLMRSFLVFSSKQKSDIEQAINHLVKLANEQHVGFNFKRSIDSILCYTRCSKIRQYFAAKSIR